MTASREVEALKFFHSPEFLRYQYLSWDHLLDLMGAHGHPANLRLSTADFGRFLGAIFGISVSSFVQVCAEKRERDRMKGLQILTQHISTVADRAGLVAGVHDVLPESVRRVPRRGSHI